MKWNRLVCRVLGHESGIGGDGKLMYGWCPRCWLTSPNYPHQNGAWGKDLVRQAERDGVAFYRLKGGGTTTQQPNN